MTTDTGPGEAQSAGFQLTTTSGAALIDCRVGSDRWSPAVTDPFMDRDPDRIDLHARLRYEPDDATPCNWGTEFAEVPNVTCADTLEQLRALTRGLNERCQWKIDPDYIEAQIAHESEHAAAARAAGFSRVRYGLGEWVERSTDDGTLTVVTRWQVMVFHVAPLRPVSKLAYAAITAAPAHLSAGDMEALRDLGYRDAEDVAARIREFNVRTGTTLPMPASVPLREDNPHDH